MSNNKSLPELAELTPERLLLRRVVCAAVKHGEHVVIGPRHFDLVMHRTIRFNPELAALNWHQAEQGFIDQWGHFMDRKEALEVATKQGQIINYMVPTTGGLYSEHLY